MDLSIIPTNPGCYLYKDKSKKIIYIGKAKNLKKRVSSYFTKKNHDPKTEILVSKIDSVDFIITNSESEALILENNLIKKHQPKYNINLKDSKRYAYIKITKEEYPRVIIARVKKNDGTYFGPFVSAVSRDYIIELLNKSFKLRTCKKLPKKACLRYHINLCDAPCINEISKTRYLENISSVKRVLKGEIKEQIIILKKRMNFYSEKLDFERAKDLRDQIKALEWLSVKQTMERQKSYDEDIINYLEKDNTMYVILFNVYKGILENKQEFELPSAPDFLEQFLSRYYEKNPIPKEIITSRAIDSELKSFLELKRKSKINFVVPKIGEKKNLLDLVMKNIEIHFFGQIKKLEDLKKKLRMQEIPKVIECFDISHLSGTSTVASMVQFRNGIPDKNNYRRFKIKTVDGIDDFASMAEVMRRRYTRLKNENLEMPDLIVVDGGKGQLSASVEILRELELKIAIISLAKREEEVFVPGFFKPLPIAKKTSASLLLQQIRDEAHRFAISYNRLLRKKKLKDEFK